MVRIQPNSTDLHRKVKSEIIRKVKRIGRKVVIKDNWPWTLQGSGTRLRVKSFLEVRYPTEEQAIRAAREARKIEKPRHIPRQLTRCERY